MKIIVVHAGDDAEALLLTSLVIGLRKKYPKSDILWVGNPAFFPLVKYNKRIKKCFDISKVYDLSIVTHFYGSDLCVNITPTSESQKFTQTCGAELFVGFYNNVPIDKNVEFFRNVITGKVKTNKTILDLCYNVANLKWRGEGYGLSYYPRQKQTKHCGIFLKEDDDSFDGEKIQMPAKLLKRFDTINQFSTIVTDDIFVAHASLALRKKLIFKGNPTYNFNFDAQKII